MTRLPPDIRDKREALHRRARTLGFLCYARKGHVPAQIKHVLRVTESDEAFLSREYVASGRDETEIVNVKGVREDRERRYNELYRDYLRAELAGKKFKIWRTERDRKVRESHARVDRISVPIDESFIVGGEKLFLPSDPGASFEETANCRCTVEYEVAQAGGGEPRINDAPVVDDVRARRESVINNTPAVFEISDSLDADGSRPWYEIDEFSEVADHDSLIEDVAKEQQVDPDLIRAIMHMETTHGWYDRLVPGNETLRPMNIHAKFWKDLGWAREDLEDPEINVRAGATLLRRLRDRIEDPTVEKIATIYNYLGAKKVSDYGARVRTIYQERLWDND